MDFVVVGNVDPFAEKMIDILKTPQLKVKSFKDSLKKTLKYRDSLYIKK